MEGIELVDRDSIPEKDMIMKRLKLKLNHKVDNDLKYIIILITNRIKTTSIKEKDLFDIVWELINCGINETIEKS